MSLITTILNPPDDGQSLHKFKKARKKRKNKGRKLVESAEREQRPLQSVYHHYYTRIGELFFLKQRYLCINKFVLYRGIILIRGGNFRGLLFFCSFVGV